jgi:hypothetical protein
MTSYNLPPDPPTDLEGPPMPALVSGTSQEFVGGKPLPRTIRSRTMAFVLGPPGVGKTTVAKSLAGPDALYLSEAQVLEALNTHARNRAWNEELLKFSSVVLECPCFMERRPSALQTLQALLRVRSGGGRRTVICEANSGTSMEDLMGAVHPGYRATVVLRFPVGRGRLRFALRVCNELGLSADYAKATEDLEPWTYAAVRTVISTRS